MHFYKFFVLIFRVKNYIRVDSYVFCMSDYLISDTILQRFSTERDVTGLSISKQISYPETQKGIREGYGKSVLLNIQLWKRKSATFDLLISFAGRGEIKEINIQGKKDTLNDQRYEYTGQERCSQQNKEMNMAGNNDAL